MRFAPLRPRIRWLVRRWPRQSFIVASALDAAITTLRSSRHPWYFRQQVTSAVRWYPLRRWPFPCTVVGPDPASMRPPMILVSFHAGGLSALGLLFEQLPGKVAVLVAGMYNLPSARPGVDHIATGGSEHERIAAAKRAGDVLRDRGFVFIALDGRDGAKTPLAMFGRTFQVSSGAFRLARMTNAPIVPVMPEWREGRMKIVIGEPIGPADEAAMAAGLASWLEEVYSGGDRGSRLLRRLERLSRTVA